MDRKVIGPVIALITPTAMQIQVWGGMLHLQPLASAVLLRWVVTVVVEVEVEVVKEREAMRARASSVDRKGIGRVTVKMPTAEVGGPVVTVLPIRRQRAMQSMDRVISVGKKATGPVIVPALDMEKGLLRWEGTMGTVGVGAGVGGCRWSVRNVGIRATAGGSVAFTRVRWRYIQW